MRWRIERKRQRDEHFTEEEERMLIWQDSQIEWRIEWTTERERRIHRNYLRRERKRKYQFDKIAR